jgi:hypothetical protein
MRFGGLTVLQRQLKMCLRPASALLPVLHLPLLLLCTPLSPQSHPLLLQLTQLLLLFLTLLQLQVWVESGSQEQAMQLLALLLQASSLVYHRCQRYCLPLLQGYCCCHYCGPNQLAVGCGPSQTPRGQAVLSTQAEAAAGCYLSHHRHR